MAKLTDTAPSPAPADLPSRRAKRVGDRPGVRQTRWTPALFLAIPVALYATWVIAPMFYTFWMSLTNADGISQSDYVGLRNYRRLLEDDIFWTSFWNNVRWLLVFITVPTAIGLMLALVLNQDLPGVRIIKAGIFSPMVLSTVVIANVWSWMYFPQNGLINATLGAIGYGGKRLTWLADPDLAIWAVIGAAVWRQIGYVMLIYLAGLKGVDGTLVDAAKIDGAGPVRSFFSVVLPQLMPVNVVVLVISVIDALRSFDLVNLMTRGGPYNQTNVLAQQMYIEAFNNYKMGYGAAIAVVLALISMVIIFTYLFFQVRDELEY